MSGKPTVVAAIVLHGISGPLKVKGNEFNGAMPAFGGQLQDAEIAAVLTHVRSTWGNASPVITTETVTQVRKDTASRTEPFKGDSELDAMEK